MGYQMLILAILALGVVLIGGSPSNVNPDAYRREGDATQIISMARALALDVHAYELNFRKSIDLDAWRHDLVRNEATPPKQETFRMWYLGENAQGRFICVQNASSPTAYQIRVFERAAEQLERSILNQECGAETPWDGETQLDRISLTIQIGR